MKINYYQQQFVLNVAKLILYADAIGVKLTFGEAYRSKEQQQIYFDKGLTRTLNSNHMKRLAVDFNFFIRGELIYRHDLIDQLGEFWEKLNEKNRWGGNFNSILDTPHFEMHL
jgi:hypothetical protein